MADPAAAAFSDCGYSLSAQGPVTAHMLGGSRTLCMRKAQQKVGSKTPADASQATLNMLDIAR